MKRIVLIFTAVLALAGSASLAQAADLCVQVHLPMGTFQGHLVGKGFKVPSKNKCKPFNGFMEPGHHFGAMAVGTGCTKADGSLFRLHVTTHAADSSVTRSWACNFVLPGMSIGNCAFKTIDDNQNV